MESRKHYTGLTDKQVLESREKHGTNVLTPPKRDSLCGEEYQMAHT